MFGSLTENTFSAASATSSSQGSAFSTSFERATASQLTSFGARAGTRARKEIGEFTQLYTTRGSVNRQFPEVFRFSLRNQTRVRIYLTNEFTNTRSDSQRMTLNLLNDDNLRSLSSITVNPRSIGSITRNINPGTYRLRLTTQTNSRGRYFLDMVRL